MHAWVGWDWTRKLFGKPRVQRDRVVLQSLRAARGAQPAMIDIDDVGRHMPAGQSVSPWDNVAPPDVDPGLFVSSIEDDVCSLESFEGVLFAK